LKIFNNKGAMFGLDARIALAIFGALSIISGAALYSAIKDAKLTAYIADVQEMGKAWEQFYLDTGQTLPQRSTTDNTHPNFYQLKSSNLVENIDNIANWKGPYINYPISVDYFVHPIYGNMYYRVNRVGDWDSSAPNKADSICSPGFNCELFISQYNMTKDFVEAVDLKVDGVLNSSNGKVRYYDSVSSGYYISFYIAPHKQLN
jgi:hypothetical protein